MLLLLFIISITFALADECTNIYKPREVIARAMNKDIHLTMKSYEIEMVHGYIRDARRIYNPEFEHFTTQGRQGEEFTENHETRLWFIFQLGSKREKKALVFEAQESHTKTELKLLENFLKKEFLHAFIRALQIKNQLVTIGRLKSSLNQYIHRYEKIPHLTPEQQIDKGLLEMSLTDLDLTEAALHNENLLIGRFYQRILAENCFVKIEIPENSRPNKWPPIEDLRFVPDQSLNIKLAQLTLEKTEFEFNREESKVWPDLKIGPVWQRNTIQGRESDLFGLSIILPIPSTDLNKGLREAASANQRRHEKHLSFQRDQNVLEFHYRKSVYETLRSRYNAYQRLNDFSALIRKSQNLFKRGLISIPHILVIKQELLSLTRQVYRVENDIAEHLIEIFFINNLPIESVIYKALNL
jgi:hypothetical protein